MEEDGDEESIQWNTTTEQNPGMNQLRSQKQAQQSGGQCGRWSTRTTGVAGNLLELRAVENGE